MDMDIVYILDHLRVLANLEFSVSVKNRLDNEPNRPPDCFCGCYSGFFCFGYPFTAALLVFEFPFYLDSVYLLMLT